MSAPLFVDATGDGVLAFRVGADFRPGREARHEYDEPLAPQAADERVMGNTLFFRAIGQLAQQINLKWQASNRTLPDSLDKFPDNAKKNPANGAAFTYRIKSASEYDLCSTFLTDNRDAPYGTTADRWLHPQGGYCFTFDPAQEVNVPWVPNY